MIPREFFPTMPDEVFESWLAPFIAAKGWPFKSITEDLQKNEWKYRLGVQSTLQAWSSSSWELLKFQYSDIQFRRADYNIILDIINHCGFGMPPTKTANVMDSKARFDAIASFVSVNGVIPRPIVFRANNDGSLSIMDGNHRFSAFAFVHRQNPNPPPIPAWVVKL